MNRDTVVRAGAIVVVLCTAGVAAYRPYQHRAGVHVGAKPTPQAVCHANGALPDIRCTPGAVDSAVTQGNIHDTICVNGYATKVRPTLEQTAPIKRERFDAYGLRGQPFSGYELDHLVSLELGGAPLDTRNLWPEAYDPTPGAHQKDGYENYLHTEVCAGRMSLVNAQRQIAVDWVSGWNQAGRP